MIGSGKAAELAARFEQAHGELLVFAERCSDGDWSAVTEGEQWPVGVVVDHIADGYAAFDRWLAGYLEGRGVTETRALIDEGNARHALTAAELPREDTMARLRDNAERALAMIRGLSDEHLAITLPMAVAGGAPVSAEQLVETLLRHTSRHLGSCLRTVGG